MCIILYTTKKIGLPTDETLKFIFKSNPDGAGMACVYTNEEDKRFIRHQKGLMKEKEYMDTVKDFYNRMTKDDDYLIVHTRISTHGGVLEKNTHPFKTPDGSLLFHNGICSKVTPLLKGNESDTEYVANHFTTLEDLQKIDTLSRYIVIYPDGTCEKIGSWVQDADGRQWSNGGYIPYSYSKYNYKSYHSRYYDDTDDYNLGYYSPSTHVKAPSSKDSVMLKMFVQSLQLDGLSKYLSKLYDKLNIRLSHDGKWSILGQPIKRVDEAPLPIPTRLDHQTYFCHSKTPLFKIYDGGIFYPCYDDAVPDFSYKIYYSGLRVLIEYIKEDFAELFENEKTKTTLLAHKRGSITLDKSLVHAEINKDSHRTLDDFKFLVTEQDAYQCMLDLYFDFYNIPLMARANGHNIVIGPTTRKPPSLKVINKDLSKMKPSVDFDNDKLIGYVSQELRPYAEDVETYILEKWLNLTPIVKFKRSTMSHLDIMSKGSPHYRVSASYQYTLFGSSSYTYAASTDYPTATPIVTVLADFVNNLFQSLYDKIIEGVKL